MQPQLARITIYPFKSLDGISLSEVIVLKNGALENDRRFVIVDKNGKYLTGKRQPELHQLRSNYNVETRTITFQDNDSWAWHSFQIDNTLQEAEQWLSNYLHCSVTIQENNTGGFPDDLEYPGATVVSTATLEKVIEWYPEITLDEARRRFRANLEISGVPAFWEDRLYRQTGVGVPFQIGDVRLMGMNPCARCAIPSRHPETGVAIKSFQKEFAIKRQNELPNWAELSRFDHYYRLAVNTTTHPNNKGIKIQTDDDILLL